MNTKFLRTFLLVHKTGSMAQAAREQNITHGAVAQQILTLEYEIGCQLVSRVGRTVNLTEAGLKLLSSFEIILNEIEQLPKLANTKEIRGEIKVGAGNSVLNSVLPSILSCLTKNYPEVNVKIQPGISSDFFARIENGNLDVAIAIEPPFVLPKSLQWNPLREEPFVLLAAMKHAEKEPHELLRRLPFIRYDKTSWTGKIIDNYLRSINVDPIDRFELNAIESIAMMVNQDLGVSIVPDSANLYLRSLSIIKLPLINFKDSRKFGLVWSRNSPRLSLVKAFNQVAVNEYSVFGN